MSNADAVAAVTLTLKQVLKDALEGVEGAKRVSTLPPQEALEDETDVSVNLFLYHVDLNAALGNMDLSVNGLDPTGHPPLALQLHYLLTAFGTGEEGVATHKALGRCMSALHDHPLLGPAEIERALSSSDLHRQIERVRVTFDPMTAQEMHSLWQSYQVRYRPSVAYLASAVLVESQRPTPAPLPVLEVGTRVVGDALPRVPTLVALEVPNGRPAAELGDELTLHGHHLDTVESVVVRPARHPEHTTTLRARVKTGEMITVDLRDTNLVAGIHAVSATTPGGGTTNDVPLVLAPRIVMLRSSGRTGRPPDTQVTVRCVPRVRARQRVSLLVGTREVPSATPGEPQFRLADLLKLEDGAYPVRLRVDGVDSRLDVGPKAQRLLRNRASAPGVSFVRGGRRP